MNLPLKIISTDFDGTFHAEFADPPVPPALQELIGRLQRQGVLWIINTGRDLSSLMETLGRDQIAVWPDYVVTVEREIHRRDQAHYVALEDWNEECQRVHDQLFRRIRSDLPELVRWIESRFAATLYEDSFSPLCLIAQNCADADAIHEYLNGYCERIPHLTVVRNDVYARFCHERFNKGAALGEISRRLGIPPASIAAAGDHYNDLPMLRREYAHWLVAPSNAVETVKEQVRQEGGFVSGQPQGLGVLQGLETILERIAASKPKRSARSRARRAK